MSEFRSTLAVIMMPEAKWETEFPVTYYVLRKAAVVPFKQKIVTLYLLKFIKDCYIIIFLYNHNILWQNNVFSYSLYYFWSFVFYHTLYYG